MAARKNNSKSVPLSATDKVLKDVMVKYYQTEDVVRSTVKQHPMPVGVGIGAALMALVSEVL